MRLLYAAVLLLLTTSIYGQKSTLLQNVNVRAKELKHRLNKTGDSLILEGERTIYKVEIFNNDYEESLIVKDSKVIIPLNNVPVGRFIVEAVLPDRLIIITLLRNETLSPAINIPKPRRKTSLFGDSPSEPVIAISTPKKEVIERKVAVIDNELNLSDKIAVETDETIAVTDETVVVNLKKVSLFDKTETDTNNTVAVIDSKLSLSDMNVVRTDETIDAANKKESLFDKKETAIDNTVAVVDTNLKQSDKKAVETDETIAVANMEESLFNKKQIVTVNTVAITSEKADVTDKKTATIDINSTIVDAELTVIDLNNTINNKNIKASKNTIENAGRRVVVSYWIVYKTNNRHSSGREMRFGDKKLVNKMISHNNLDRRTKAGKFNELYIWEIYDVSNFLKYKMKNPNGFSSESDSFNSIPFYKMENDSNSI